jgi:hypothetical protein
LTTFVLENNAFFGISFNISSAVGCKDSLDELPVLTTVEMVNLNAALACNIFLALALSSFLWKATVML